MKHKSLIAFFALGLTLVLAGCSSSSGTSSITAPKKISFEEQSKGSGTHVWVESTAESMGISKDDKVNHIFVMNDGKTRVYQIFDNNVTLGKLSSMNDADTIKLAKAQDKKYATTGAIQEIKNYQQHKPSVGQEKDFEQGIQAASRGDISLFYTYKNGSDGNDTSSVDQQKNISNIYALYDQADDAANNSRGANELGEDGTTLNSLGAANHNIDKSKYGKALINHIKDSTYHEPKAQNITIKNKTDNSGNKVISQNVKFYSRGTFDRNAASRNAYIIAMKNKKDALKLFQFASGNYYGGNLDKMDTEETLGIENDSDENVAKYKAAMEKVNAEGSKIYEKLYGNKYSELTKDIYGPYYFKENEVFSSPTSQKIYKARYIGYERVNGDFLLTKAQNNKQKAVLSK